MTKWEKEERLVAILAVGMVFFVIAGFAYAFWVECATPTITPAGPNCVIIQKGFRKDVRCFTNVDMNTEAR